MNQTTVAKQRGFAYTEVVNAATSQAREPDFKKGAGIVPAIAQEAETGEVLMLAYMNEAAWRQTLATGKAHYYSRSRDKLWMKGEESGNVQTVESVALDCDADTVLLRVKQTGSGACHTGTRTCFTGRDVPLSGGQNGQA